MFILLITRGIPEPQDPQWGCFEKDQAEALAAQGHKVVCLSVDGRFRKYWRKLGTTRVEINGVEYYNWFLTPVAPLSKISQRVADKYKFNRAHYLLKKILKNLGKPDVIYAQWYSNMLIGIKFRAKYGIPVVGIEHAARFGIGSTYPMSSLNKRCGGYAFSNVDALVTVSKNLQGGIKQNFGVDSIVINNLVGGDFIFHEPIGHKAFNFVSVGTLEHRKGFDIVIEALNQLKDKSNIIINIIGEGGERANLQKKIDDCGLTDNVKLVGKMQKPQIVDVMRRSDAFVFGTRNENFSVAILEALSQGLPSIVTDCGGARDCVNDLNGVIVDVENVEQMAEAMQFMVDNINRYDRRVIADDFQHRFSAESIARQISDVLESVVNKNK